MYNDILKIGSLSIHGYGLMIGIGVIVALVVAAVVSRRFRKLVFSLRKQMS